MGTETLTVQQIDPPKTGKCCGGVVKKVLLGLLVLVIAFVVLVMFQPSRFRVERSAVMGAPRAVVFAQVNDFHNWEAWSPWAKRDPAAKSTFEGPASGTGA